MMAIPIFIFWLTSAVAVVQNSPNPTQVSLPELDDEAFADMIETLKVAEAENKAMEEQRVASFSKGVQRASITPNGTFSFPANCTPTNQTKGYPYCNHGSLQENETTKVEAVVDFFDLNDPSENTIIGLKTVYKDDDVQKLQAEAGGQAELFTFGKKKKVAGSFFLATHLDEDLYNPPQVGIMRDSFVAKVHFMIYVHGYLVVNVESVAVQRSDVFAGKPYNIGFNMSASYEKGIQYGISVGASIELSLRTIKNALYQWRIIGHAEIYLKTPLSTIHFPYTYIAQDILI